MNGAGRQNMIRYPVSLCAALLSAIALFANVEGGGGLSGSMNGTGLAAAGVTLLLAYGYYREWSQQVLRGRLSRRERRGAVITAVLFALFLTNGKAQRASGTLKWTIFGPVMFAGYLFFFLYLMLLIYHLVNRYRERGAAEATDPVQETGRLTTWLFETHPVAATMGVIIFFRIPYLIACYPCSMTWDGGVQIGQVLGLNVFTDRHPPFVSMVYGGIASLAMRSAHQNAVMFLIPLMQVALSSFAVSRIFVFMKRRHTGYVIRWCTLVYFSIFTIWPVFDMAVLKDTLYYPLTLLYVFELLTCVYDPDLFYGKKLPYLKTGVVAVLMTLVRYNGALVLLATLPVMLYFAVRRDHRGRGCAGMICAVVLVLAGLSNLIFPAMGVIRVSGTEDLYSLMFQQTAAYAAAHPDDVAGEERAVLTWAFDYNAMQEAYNPHIADWAKGCLWFQPGEEEDPTGAFWASVKDDYLRVWAAQGKRHPSTYLKTVVECTYGWYDPEETPYQGAIGYEEGRLTFWYMPEVHQIESLAPIRRLLMLLSKVESAPMISLLYHPGFYTWCVLFVMICLIAGKRYRDLIVTLPAAVNVLCCTFSPVNTCIRYAMPTMCLMPLLAAVLLQSSTAPGNEVPPTPSDS